MGQIPHFDRWAVSEGNLTAMEPIKAILADDHELIRASLKGVLELDGEVRVLDSVSNAADAIDATVAHTPDVVLLDIQMPGLDCFHAVKEIRLIRPDTRIVILSGRYSDRYIESALRVGADGYVTKNDDVEHVLKAVKSVYRGKQYFSPTVVERLARERHAAPTPRAELLTEREWETLGYLARGYAKKQIATTMYISGKTVEKHTQSIMDKLAIHDRVRLSIWYAEYHYKSESSG